uniref:Uncharacterized protein n=1 Tax=Vespula pensylvanica TaxID=30213 RepID=A0A834PGL3_VESPE|nr:hypothetical protein H0235_001763 [Vespula pensylvanica]
MIAKYSSNGCTSCKGRRVLRSNGSRPVAGLRCHGVGASRRRGEGHCESLATGIHGNECALRTDTVSDVRHKKHKRVAIMRSLNNSCARASYS